MEDGTISVRSWIDSAKLRLASNGVDSPGLEAQLLAGHVLLVNRPWLLAHAEEPFPELAGESVLDRRLNGEPLAYILGYREFYGRRFAVGPGVLIPRQDTEILVEAALSTMRSLNVPQPNILDLGTGSGCIAITLKLEAPTWNVTASDLSQKALEIAMQNGQYLNADVTWICADGFAGMDSRKFDVIVTNPPYIGLNEPLAKEVKGFEPHQALYSGDTGLEFYLRLSMEAKQRLHPGGFLLMEVGYEQAKTVEELFADAGWTHAQTVRDLAGIPRVVVCTNENEDLVDQTAV